ncbi:unnamed protein product [Blepharisma stoltei]|uniref:Uncharacterized protein n=1 Tax=Blepharisma stoltei TaxID=1481888 RepID=A0AAU9IDV3_9CILI|nr:unnamed protein product [Blepharisma stoltei]
MIPKNLSKSESKIPRTVYRQWSKTVDETHMNTLMPPKSFQLDLHQLRKERLMQKQYSSFTDRSPTEEKTLDKLNDVEAEWQRYKSVGKQRPDDEPKLLYHHDNRPQTSLRLRPAESDDLIRLAKTAMVLLERTSLEVIHEVPEKKNLAKTPDLIKKKKDINLTYKPVKSKLVALNGKHGNLNSTHTLVFKNSNDLVSPKDRKLIFNKTHSEGNSDLMRIIRSAQHDLDLKPVKRVNHNK